MAWLDCARGPITVYIALIAASCGYTDAGTGTHTLQVQAALHYTWQADSTQADLWVTRAGTAVAGAHVYLTDAKTKVQHTLVANGAAGHYTLALCGYVRALQLDVSADSDALVCQVEGPGRHVITEPAAGTVISSTQALAVHWRTDDGVRADSVTVSVEGANWSQRLADDQGHSVIPASILTPGTQTLKIERHSQVVPEGGAGHSHVDVVYAVSTPFQVSGRSIIPADQKL